MNWPWGDPADLRMNIFLFLARSTAFLPRLAALRLPAFLRVALALVRAAPPPGNYLVPRF